MAWPGQRTTPLTIATIRPSIRRVVRKQMGRIRRAGGEPASTSENYMLEEVATERSSEARCAAFRGESTSQDHELDNCTPAAFRIVCGSVRSPGKTSI